VPQKDVEAALGSDGAAALRAMVRANILGLRYPSPWKQDIPARAFTSADGWKDQVLVTASSATALHCFRLLHKRRVK
jgi:hypothetical protein